MDDVILAYCRADAEITFRFWQDWDETYIEVGGLYYDRQEWARYCREKRRWAQDDPTVDVPMPVGFRRKMGLAG